MILTEKQEKIDKYEYLTDEEILPYDHSDQIRVMK